MDNSRTPLSQEPKQAICGKGNRPRIAAQKPGRTFRLWLSDHPNARGLELVCAAPPPGNAIDGRIPASRCKRLQQPNEMGLRSTDSQRLSDHQEAALSVVISFQHIFDHGEMSA